MELYPLRMNNNRHILPPLLRHRPISRGICRRTLRHPTNLDFVTIMKAHFLLYKRGPFRGFTANFAIWAVVTLRPGSASCNSLRPEP